MSNSNTHESGFLLTDSEIIKIACTLVTAYQKPADKADAEISPLLANVVKVIIVMNSIPATISRITFKNEATIPNDGIYLLKPKDKPIEFSENDPDTKKVTTWLSQFKLKKEPAQWHKVQNSDIEKLMTY
jgi:hypothetical protein